MKKLSIANSEIMASEIALGCMRISNLPPSEASKLLDTALDEGINFFDNADIYGGGKSEEAFAQALEAHPGIRDSIIIQTKCGIRNGCYDFSKEHILSSVDGSLRRLNTDYIDILLLHRPDTLMEPEEVAEAFSILHRSGKVRYFGVSNEKPLQIELLQKYVGHRLIIDQLQFGIAHTGIVDSGLNVNMNIDPSVDRDGSILEYCRLKGITIQAWSPFQYGFFEGIFLNNEKFPELNAVIDKYASSKNTTAAAIAIAWILRHPAHIQPIVGTTNPQRLRDICRASDVELTRREWYEIYKAAGNKLP